MLLTLAYGSFIKRAGAFLCSLLFLLGIATGCLAQIGATGIDEDPASGMRRGTNTIVGQVFYPSGTRVDKRYTVRLSSVSVGEFSTMTDDNGIFVFRRLREGSYFITVEAGKDELPATETVDFYDNRGRSTTVQLQLRVKPLPANKVGVVNVALAGV